MQGHWGRLFWYFVISMVLSSIVVFALPLIFGGSLWMPESFAEEAWAIDALFWGLTVLSIVIFSIVAALVWYSVRHFAAEPGDESDGEHIHGNARLEWAWVLIPGVIVFVIAIVSFVVLEDQEVGLYQGVRNTSAPGDSAEMDVDVRGFSFGWEFRYVTADDVDDETPGSERTDHLTSNELFLPVGTLTRFNVLACSGNERLGRIWTSTMRELAAEKAKEPEVAREFAEIDPSWCERMWDNVDEEDVQATAEEAEAVYLAREARADGEELTAEQQDLLDAQPTYAGDQRFIDVNHAFWVPESRLKIDAVAGLPTYVQWEPTKVNGPDEPIQVVCAELCGAGHNGMRVDLCLTEPAVFEWWLALDEEDRRTATCANVRYLACDELSGLDGEDAWMEAVTSINDLRRTEPDASCADADEALAA